jgi:sigma-E factor negative regulatory protein RseC
MPEKRITHEGVIASMSEDRVTVKITSYAACNSCHAKGACHLAGGEEEKLLHVPVPDPNFRVGEKVRVILARSRGFRALFLGYFLPLLMVLSMLLAMTAAGSNELVAGLSSLAVLIPYYLGIRLMRGKVDRQFSFFIQKT